MLIIYIFKEFLPFIELFLILFEFVELEKLFSELIFSSLLILFLISFDMLTWPLINFLIIKNKINLFKMKI